MYLTTAINYTNGKPHLGHAYEAIVADCLARWYRNNGTNVFFLTGTDEHGQKIAETAAKQGLTPIQLCDYHSQQFQDLDKSLQISYDNFIRTSSENHKKTAIKIWKTADQAGDIYLGEYKGWYSVREERFLTEFEAKEMNYMDGTVPLKEMNEPSYFFRLSRYHSQIQKHIQDHPEFIFPAEKRNEILERLQNPLIDLSISRTKIQWGISVPIHDHVGAHMHIMYVWFDALTNYLSGAPEGSIPPVHLIGKDIVWFHAVIWPAILLSVGLSLPKQIVCHGFINAADGRKMSKSFGNAVDPIEMIDKYGTDPFRYFMLTEGSFGNDFNFNETSLKNRFNTELANKIGNLVQRGLKLPVLKTESKVPFVEADKLFEFQLKTFFDNYDFSGAFHQVMEYVHQMNSWLTQQYPYQNSPKIVRTVLEGIYIIAHLIEPALPKTSQIILERLGTKKIPLSQLNWNNLKPGTVITPGEPLFPRL